ncbi:UNKNOWN [Stylonychia lemnae]|uniref:Uncharacterized protein n=1 Tax=Stylonychia lemnae TaxID=5949 RepID=A0A078AUU7_STYLE|nr:UNKNOWN [Stylonychia lemnae]|eukprot:CDW85781.1 UNKNOWN [Stylonychia lemnae]
MEEATTAVQELSINSGSIHPCQLFSSDSQFKSDILKSSFGVATVARYQHQSQSQVFKCVVIVDAENEAGEARDLQPRDLNTIYADYHDEIDSDHYFNWRWFVDVDGKDVKLLTVEDLIEEPLPENKGGEFKVTELLWTEGAQEEVKGLDITWRLFRKGKSAEHFKVVTLE